MRMEQCIKINSSVLLGIFLFLEQGDKLSPAGEGGMYLTNNQAMWERAVLFGDITRIIELESSNKRFAATSFGMKTRIAPVSAVIGLESLKKLDTSNIVRNANMEQLAHTLIPFEFKCYHQSKYWQRTYFEFVVKSPLWI